MNIVNIHLSLHSAETIDLASVPTQVVTLNQVVTSDYLGLTQVITTIPADPSGNPSGWTWHIYRQGSAEYFLGFKVRKSVFFWVLVITAVFLGCKINAVFLSFFICFQRYF